MGVGEGTTAAVVVGGSSSDFDGIHDRKSFERRVLRVL